MSKMDSLDTSRGTIAWFLATLFGKNHRNLEQPLTKEFMLLIAVSSGQIDNLLAPGKNRDDIIVATFVNVQRFLGSKLWHYRDPVVLLFAALVLALRYCSTDYGYTATIRPIFAEIAGIAFRSPHYTQDKLRSIGKSLVSSFTCGRFTSLHCAHLCAETLTGCKVSLLHKRHKSV